MNYSLQLRRLAKITLLYCNPPAEPAYKLAVLYQRLVIFRIAEMVSYICQITQMFIVTRMRHLYLCHNSVLLKQMVNLSYFNHLHVNQTPTFNQLFLRIIKPDLIY